jgi:serine/threonine-protein kinase
MDHCPKCHSQLDARSNLCVTCGLEGGDAVYGAWVGKVVDGRYRVLELIGRGGMGEVYRVEHVRMGKIAAMKILHAEHARDREVVARFRREARVVAKLDSPHTAQIFDSGEHDGALYIAMEYVKGRDLGVILRQEGALAYARAVPLLIQVCLAIEEAHRNGIVHRDLKPENVMVCAGPDGAEYAKVLDFGLSRLKELGPDDCEITAKGNVIGTPYYMSPEHIRGEELDVRADVYSLGATLYRMVTGEPPYQANTPVGVITLCLTEPLVPPGRRRPDLNIPGELESAIMQAMAKDRSERFDGIRPFRKCLESVLSSVSAPRIALLPEDRSSEFTLPKVKVATRSPFASENHLRREDLDGFETALRRRRLAGLLAIPVLLTLAAGAVAAYLLWPRARLAGMTEEREPNHRLEEANPIARGRAVRGQIGKRLSETKSDVDIYRFVIRAGGPVRLTARLSGLPYIDTTLQIYDAEGREVAAVNNAPERQEEVLPNLVVPPGTYYAVVQELAGKAPGTNVNDWYRLVVDWRPLAREDEVEPNDALETANRIRWDEAVAGVISRADDVDVFAPEGGGGGTVSAELTPPAGVELRLRAVGFLPGAAPGAALDCAWVRSVDGDVRATPLRLEGLEWLPGAPPPRFLVERRLTADQLAARERPVAGYDQPYRLVVRFQRGTYPAAPVVPVMAAPAAPVVPVMAASAAPVVPAMAAPAAPAMAAPVDPVRVEPVVPAMAAPAPPEPVRPAAPAPPEPVRPAPREGERPVAPASPAR